MNCRFYIFSFLFSLLSLTIDAQDIEAISKAKAWEWSGGVNTNINIYNVSGIDRRSNPFFWNLSANMNGKLYGFNLPFSFTIGQHDFQFSRPFFQMGASPSYKWIKLHLGTRNITFSPFTLAGHRMDGIGVELTPGKIRFSAVYGRFNKARDYDPEADNRFRPIVYKRMGYAFKLGYGTENNYFDLIYFRAKDDKNSVNIFPADSLITPGENMVIGFSTKLSLTKQFSFFTEGAASAYTRNLNSFPVKNYIEPDISSIYDTRYSTRLNYALKTGFHLNYSRFGVRFSYERIMPEFETMGAYFFANDREVFTISPRISLFNRKANVNGRIGLERNNLLNNRREQTNKLIGMLNFSYFNPSGFGFSANYTNLSVDQSMALSEVIDSVAVSVVNTNINFTPSYTWSDTSKTQSIILNISHQKLKDKNPFTREFGDMSSNTINSNYNLNFIGSGMGLSIGANYTLIEFSNLETSRYGATAGLNKQLEKQHLSIQLSSTYNITAVSGSRDGSLFSTNLTFGFNPNNKHSFSLFATLLRNNSETFDDYTEIYAGLNYGYRFR